jgi:hypothetical protein
MIDTRESVKTFVHVPQVSIVEAMHLREVRDRTLRNRYEVDGVIRWAGDLAEIVFQRLWPRFDARWWWSVADAVGKADFFNGRHWVDIKESARGDPPLAKYECGFEDYPGMPPTNYYFFMSYVRRLNNMYLLGGISAEKFNDIAIHYPPGEWPRNMVKSRENESPNDYLEVKIAWLDQPFDWFRSF